MSLGMELLFRYRATSPKEETGRRSLRCLDSVSTVILIDYPLFLHRQMSLIECDNIHKCDVFLRNSLEREIASSRFEYPFVARAGSGFPVIIFDTFRPRS